MPRPDRCADPAPQRLTLDLALARMRALVRPLENAERVPLKAARGRILAEDISAPLDLPPFPCSAMDGYAVHRDDLRGGGRLPVAGASLAGHPYGGTLRPGACIRVFTGALLPEGAAAVAAQEDVCREGDSIRLLEPLAVGEYVRPRGDDIKAGECLLPAGRRLEPADLGLLAASGRLDVRVRARPRVGFLATGDELRPTWLPLGPGEIHDSNRYVLDACLAELGAEPLDLGIVPDDPEAFGELLQDAATRADAIVTTGGASVGDADHLVEVIRRVGYLEFWKVAIKPGKPFAFGRIGDCWLFGLAGNPVAVSVTFRQLVRPLLMQLMGAAPAAPLRLSAVAVNRLDKAPGRLEFQRGIYRRNDRGDLEVSGFSAQGAHRLAGMSRANCLIVLPLECSGIEPGQRVDIEPLDFPVI